MDGSTDFISFVAGAFLLHQKVTYLNFFHASYQRLLVHSFYFVQSIQSLFTCFFRDHALTWLPSHRTLLDQTIHIDAASLYAQMKLLSLKGRLFTFTATPQSFITRLLWLHYALYPKNAPHSVKHQSQSQQLHLLTLLMLFQPSHKCLCKLPYQMWLLNQHLSI